MPNFDVVTIGSALVDFYIQSPQFSLQPAQDGVMLCSSYGSKLEISDFTMVSGGGGGNTAVGFARRGFTTAAISELGTDALAEQVLVELAGDQVDTTLVIQEKREQTGMSVALLSTEGGRTILVHRGAAAMLDPKDIPVDTLQTNWIHLSSIAGNQDTLKTIFGYVQEKNVGLSWNPGSREIALLNSKNIDIAVFAPTLLFVNQEEWQALATVQDHFKQVCDRVIVTNGKQGGTVYQQSEVAMEYDLDTQVEPVDETGAGDAFAVGFVSAHLDGRNTQEAVAEGKRNAASVVQHIGAKAGLLPKQS